MVTYMVQQRCCSSEMACLVMMGKDFKYSTANLKWWEWAPMIFASVAMNWQHQRRPLSVPS